MKETFDYWFDGLQDYVKQLSLDELRKLYASRLVETERRTNQRHPAEKYESFAQRQHLLRMIFSLDWPES